MPYKIPQAKVKQRMTKEVATKRAQLTQLHREHISLRYQHAVLSQCCDLLHWLRQHQLSYVAEPEEEQLQDNSACSGESSSSFSTIDELLLLQQLQNLPCLHSLDTDNREDNDLKPSPTAAAAAGRSAAAAAAQPAAAAAVNLAQRSSSASSSSALDIVNLGPGGVPGFTAAATAAAAAAAAAATTAAAAADMVVKIEPCLDGQKSDAAATTQPPAAAGAEAPAGAGAAAAASPAAPEGTAAADDGFSVHSTLSPPGDHMHLMRRLLSMPAYPNPQSLTLHHMQDEYATIVCELSLNMTLLESPNLQASCCQEPPARVIEGLLLRHFHQLVSLLLQQRGDLVMAFYLSNCLSGDVGEERQLECVKRAVEQLQLSHEQQQKISDGMIVFKRLLAPLTQERQRLQCAGFTPTSAVTTSSLRRFRNFGSVSSGSSSSAAVAAAAAAGGATATSQTARSAVFGPRLRVRAPCLEQQDKLDEQEKIVSNLSTLLKKEMFMKACCCCNTLGCLTWIQVARLMLQMFPYPAPMAAIGQEIAAQWAQQQQQREQQQLDQELQLAIASSASTQKHSKKRMAKQRRRV